MGDVADNCPLVANADQRDTFGIGIGDACFQGTCNVLLVAKGLTAIDVIRVVQEVTGLGAKDAKTLVDSAPSLIGELLDLQTAGTTALRLEAAGATVELDCTP
ncbi:MAG: ribosomal protein L7/L12 [Myxococcales bacterium]|nr:ribosomal protein L7/L12 [Myxococcales bacterium]